MSVQIMGQDNQPVNPTPRFLTDEEMEDLRFRVLRQARMDAPVYHLGSDLSLNDMAAVAIGLALCEMPAPADLLHEAQYVSLWNEYIFSFALARVGGAQ